MSDTYLYLLLFILIYVSTVLTPYWTRRTESFGVTIPEGVYESELLKKLRKQYVWMSTGLAVILTVLFFILSIGRDDLFISNLFVALLFAYLILGFCIYLIFHRRMKRIKAASDWDVTNKQEVIVSTNFRKGKLIYSNTWFLIPFIITIGVIIFTISNYHLLPERIPMQYNFAGEVTNWADKSYRSALMLPVTMLFLMLIFAFFNTMIERAKQEIDQGNPEESIKRNTIFRRRWSLFLIITGYGTIALLTVIQASFFFSLPLSALTTASLLFTFGITGYAIYLSFKTGQGGSRITQVTGGSGEKINRDDDRYWKLGVIYFNREDPALFLEKRFGVGWTINLGRPLAWMIFLLIIAIPILITVLLS